MNAGCCRSPVRRVPSSSVLCAVTVTRHTYGDVRRHRNYDLVLGYLSLALARETLRDLVRACVAPPLAWSHDQDARRGLAVFDGLAAMALLQSVCLLALSGPSGDCLEQKLLRTSGDSPEPAMPRLSSSSILNGKVVYVGSHCV